VVKIDERTWGSSMRAGVMGAVLVGLPAYFMMWTDDGVPAVAGRGVFVISGVLVVAGTIVTGIVLVSRTRTRRLGLGLVPAPW